MDIITRDYVKNNPDKIFVFGDNDFRNDMIFAAKFMVDNYGIDVINLMKPEDFRSAMASLMAGISYSRHLIFNRKNLLIYLQKI